MAICPWVDVAMEGAAHLEPSMEAPVITIETTARRAVLVGTLPSGANCFPPFLWEGCPFEVKQPKKDALFSHGHRASE